MPDPTVCAVAHGVPGVHHGSFVLGAGAALPATFTTNGSSVTIAAGDTWFYSLGIEMKVKNGSGPTDLSLTNISINLLGAPPPPVPALGGLGVAALLAGVLAAAGLVALRSMNLRVRAP